MKFFVWLTLLLFWVRPVYSVTLDQEHIDSNIDKYKANVTYIKMRLASVEGFTKQLKVKLLDNGLPSSLILLPMLESSYNPQAISEKKAVGLWQFMPATARQYGLQVDESTDERYDIDKSTVAAIKYLKYLYHLFDQNIHLTLAAYNAGEGRVGRALQRSDSDNFSDLKLPKETRDYVYRYNALVNILDLSHDGSAYKKNKNLSYLFSNSKHKGMDLDPVAPFIYLHSSIHK